MEANMQINELEFPEPINGIKIKTESGYECIIRENAMNDMRILDALIKVESKKTEAADKVIRLVKLLDALLGEEQKDDLYDFVASREGQAKSEKVLAILREIFAAAGESKKK